MATYCSSYLKACKALVHNNSTCSVNEHLLIFTSLHPAAYMPSSQSVSLPLLDKEWDPGTLESHDCHGHRGLRLFPAVIRRWPETPHGSVILELLSLFPLTGSHKWDGGEIWPAIFVSFSDPTLPTVTSDLCSNNDSQALSLILPCSDFAVFFNHICFCAHYV